MADNKGDKTIAVQNTHTFKMATDIYLIRIFQYR